MLLEIVISAAIVLTLLGAVFSLLDPAQGAVASQPQAVDMQQRGRAAFAELQRDLLMAGSGTGPGSRTALSWLRAPVSPGGMGGPRWAAPRSDGERIAIFYSPPGGSGAHLASEVPAGAREAPVSVTPGPGCRRPPRCGVDGPGSALVFDPRGRSELFRVTRARGSAITLRRLGSDAGTAFAPGASVVPVAIRGYVLDRRRGQLRRHGGTAFTLPVLDGVVDLSVRYFGGPLPVPTPASSVRDAAERLAAPCLVAAAGAGRPPGEPAAPMRELEVEELTDGPWCGGGTAFDIDLFRVRRVRLAVRLRVVDDGWRRGLLSPGPADRQGRNGGVPDLTVRFDVAPRSLSGW